MMKRRNENTVRKLSFEEEQKEKQEYFENLSPFIRLQIAFQTRELMRKKGINYSYKGMKVKVVRNGSLQ